MPMLDRDPQNDGGAGRTSMLQVWRNRVDSFIVERTAPV